MPTLFDKDFGKFTPEELAAELGTKKAIEAATPPRESLTDFLVRAYSANPGMEFGPTGMQSGPKADPVRPPLDGGYTPGPPDMSVGEPARAPVPAPPAPVRGGGVSSKPMQEDPLAAKAAALPPPAAAPAPAPAPAPVAAAAPGPSPEEEMTAAQDESKRRMLLGMIPAFLSGFSSKGESLRKDLGSVVNSPVTDLLARRQFGHEQEKAQREREEYEKKKSMDDVGSKQSKIAQMIYIRRGVDPALAAQLPASALPEIMSAESANDAAKNQVAMREQAKAEMGSREKIAQGEQGVQREGHRLQYAAEMAKAGTKGGKEDEQTVRLLNEVKARESNIKTYGKQLRDLVEKYNTSETMTPGVETKMEQLANAIATESAKMADPASAARSDEVAREKANIFQPGMWQRKASALAGIDSYLNQQGTRAHNAFAARGLLVPASFASQSDPGNRVRVVGPNGETGTMDAAELDQHPGWKQVQ